MANVPPARGTLLPPAGHGALLLTLQGHLLTVGVLPSVFIDGYAVPGAFGPNFYPLSPGRHRVDVYTVPQLAQGHASMDVDIRAGQIVPGHYAAPTFIAVLAGHTSGSLGHEKQSRRGRGILLAVIAAIVLSPLLVLLLKALIEAVPG